MTCKVCKTGETDPMSFLTVENLTVARKREDTEYSLPEHLICLPGGQWASWRCVGLRSAGFPASLISKLSAPEGSVAADQLLQAEEDVQQARRKALEAVNRELDLLRRNHEWDNSRRRVPLVTALQRLKMEKLPEPLDDTCTAAKAIEALRTAQARVDSVREGFNQSFETLSTQISKTIREIAQMDRFREAVIWQNRRAFHTGVEPISKKPVGVVRSKERQKEELVAQYLQRYCAKNDTIGFFGPVGWARFIPKKEAIFVRSGATLLAERNVYFEQWCIDELAQALAKNGSLRPWFIPRRMPLIHIEMTTLYRPLERPIQVFPALAAVLRACDGSRSAKDIAADLIQAQDVELDSEAEVYELLELLCDRGLISWTLEVPLVLHPEQVLRRLLERIEEDHLRRPVLKTLDELEAARDAVTRGTGDVEKLDQALGDLEVIFTRLTGVASTRAPGQTYAGRTLVYEDCRRDIEVHIGAEIIESLGPPLSLLLTSARWFTFQSAAIYRKVLDEVYAVLVQQTGSSVVDLPSFWSRAQMILLSEANSSPFPIVPVLSEFQDRWAGILCVPKGQRRVQYASAALRSQVMSVFEAPAPGWQVARYHSLDVMIAASSVEAIRRGCHQLILGEVHIGTNTLRNPFFLAQHPSSQELFDAIDRDMPQPRVVPVVPREWDRITSRTYDALVSDKDFRLAFASDACGISGSRALLMGDLVVEKKGNELWVRTRDGRLDVDIVEFFGDALSLLVVHHFRILHPCSHTPRITVDNLVVCRETWRIPATEAQFAFSKSKAEGFVEARRWARAYRLPRFVFIKVPVEPKPFFVDFNSPILVNIFARAIRQTAKDNTIEPVITVTEMLPTLDQTWLTDAEGQRYTSEFRIVAVDLTA